MYLTYCTCHFDQNEHVPEDWNQFIEILKSMKRGWRTSPPVEDFKPPFEVPFSSRAYKFMSG